MKRLKEIFGNCDKALAYLQSEYNYTEQELDQLRPELDELFDNMLLHGFLDPENYETEKLMRNGIDNFFSDRQSVKRRKTMIKSSML
jgi:hypothetical protein